MAMKGVLHIPKAPALLVPHPSVCLMLYPGHSLRNDPNPPCTDAVGIFYNSGQSGDTKCQEIPSLGTFSTLN